MAEEQPEKTPKMPTSFLDLTKLLITMFGPQTFGVVLLITVWVIMVQPTLSHNSVQDKQMDVLSSDLKQARAELKELILHAKLTSELLDRILMKAER